MIKEMNFLDHLTELRSRFIKAIMGVVIGFLICYHFSEQIFNLLMQPLCGAFENQTCQLVTLGVAEAFFVYLKTGILAGFFISIPWIFYQVWKFVEPGLLPREKKLVLPVVFSASLLFVGGASFGYFVVFPFAFEFFLGVIGEGIAPMPAMQAYFSFAVQLLFAFGILFELPLVVIGTVYFGLVQTATLWRTWRYAIVGIFCVSAILTPADPFTMLLLGIPLSLMYIGSLFVCQFIERARRVPVDSETQA
jgi:sec-independent protein translocase protein TatC